MTRNPLLSSPLLLGFDEIERLIDRVGKSGGDGYPPYNIERIVASGQPAESGNQPPSVEYLRITLAVAGFLREQIEITLEDNQLIIRGRQDDDKTREYLHRGIAARQFSRTFVLADGIEVKSADLAHGLLAIDLARHEPERVVRRIAIGTGKSSLNGNPTRSAEQPVGNRVAK
jgi:HSP20 family molecular chaperone IbpA